MTSVPIPEVTPAIEKAQRANDRWMKALIVMVVAVLIATIALVVFRFSDQAKQSTTALAAKRSLTVAERQDCRSEYNSRRQSVIEDADAAGREVQATIIGYLLSERTTGDIGDAQTRLKAANERVAKLKTLPDMVDNGWNDGKGNKYPPCPVVK